MNIKSGKTRVRCVSAADGCKLLAVVIFLLAGVVLLTGCHSPRSAPEKPPWVGQPKGNDSVYVYGVGNALNRSSAAVAREAAYQDALRQLAAQAAAPQAKADRLRGVEILPGCVYYEEHDNRFDCWVQVSWPVAEKNKLIQPVDRVPPPP